MLSVCGIVITILGALSIIPSNANDLNHSSLSQLQESANKGNAEAQYLLGTRLILGQGIGQNTTAALDYIKKAAAQKYAPAITGLAELYDQGVGLKENEAEAIRLYKEAAAMREPKAEWRLGYLYTNDQATGGLGDFDKGINLIKLAGNDGSAQAAMFLARLYWFGNCKKLPRDDKEAVKWFTKAEAQGHKSAGSYLIHAYYEGRGTAKNLRKAITYFAKSESSPEGKRWFTLLSSKQTVSGEQLEQARRWMLATSNKNRQSEVGDWDLLHRK
jgi:TPR repeat protein